MLHGLLAQTTMSRSELYRLFNRFKALCQVRCRAANPPPPRPHTSRLAPPPPPPPSSLALLDAPPSVYHRPHYTPPPNRPLYWPLPLHPAPCRTLPAVARQLSGTPGSIDKKTFKEGVSSLAFEDDTFVDRVFTLLDDDHGGTIDWEEFVQTVNALETGSPHDKLAFCFQVPKLDSKPGPKPDPKPDPKP